MRLSAAQTSSWIFIIWFGSALSTFAASLYFRQPLSVTATIPGLIYLGTLGGRFSFEQIAAANLVAGGLLLVLGLSGAGRLMMRWLPLPIVLAMFAGSILDYVVRMIAATVNDAVVAGATVGCYLLARLANTPLLPPIALAAVGGALAASGSSDLSRVAWAAPQLVMPQMEFTLSAVVAVSLPLVVMSLALGNIQGLGYLLAQGYAVPVNRISTLVGLNSILNALFGGHPASVARTGTAIVASPHAGPLEGRYRAALASAVLTLVLALCASPVAALVDVLPKSYFVALAGVGVLPALQDAMEKAFAGHMRFGALVGFAVTATPFALFGITSAFWALIAGLAASAIAERRELLAFWRANIGK
jgi:benzoate membrane transport protein